MDRIQKVSSLSTDSQGGLALQSNDGKSIYYFGGMPYAKLVHKFNTETNVTVRLPTELPSPVVNAGGALVNGKMFIFNGKGRCVMEFDLESETAKIISGLHFRMGNKPVDSTTAIPIGQDGVWAIAGNFPPAEAPIVLFNATTKHSLDVNAYLLPTLYQRPVAVRVGSHGYLIGGLGRRYEGDMTYHPSDGVVR
jgi:hypothetical protein